MKDQTMKFLWFWDSFEGVWDENMQEGDFWINLEEVNFFTVLTSEVYFGNYEKSVRLMEKAISGKIVADFKTFKTS